MPRLADAGDHYTPAALQQNIDRVCKRAVKPIGEGPPVLFLQGVGVPRSGWQPQLDALSAEFTCAAPDNRGCGESTGGGAPFTLENTDPKCKPCHGRKTREESGR